MSSPADAKKAKQHIAKMETTHHWVMTAVGLVPSFVPTAVSLPLVGVGIAASWVCLRSKKKHQLVLEEPVLDQAAMEHSLQVLHHLLGKYPDQPTDDPKHRICVYVKNPDNPDQLKRITRQIGHLIEADKSEPDVLPLHIGVAGKVARMVRPISASIQPQENLSEYLVSEWGFTEQMARAVRTDRRAWYGVPLAVSGKPCLGVLFSDSCLTTFFGKENSARARILRCASVPIAEIIEKAYI